MKILAMEIEAEGVDWNNSEELLKSEAQYVYQLYESEIVREIYFTQNKNAILILETESITKAKNILDDFPLVKSGKIKFEIMELRPYSGWNRLML